MKVAMVLGLATAGCLIGFRCLPSKVRDRLAGTARRRVAKGMEQMMASLPESAPPKLLLSLLPRLQAQNDQIIAMLREQNELLRDRSALRINEASAYEVIP